jgi:hypothetical protein
VASSIQTKGEAKLQDFNLKYTHADQYDLAQLDKSRRIQVRAFESYKDSEWAPADSVKQFATQMAHQAFDPIIVTSDAWVVDGNTRVGARERRGDKFHPAYVLDLAWAKADEKTRNYVHILAADLNVWGKSLTPAERRYNVRYFLAEGFTEDQIASRLGIARNAVNQIKQEVAAERRMNAVGVPWNNGKGEISTVAKRSLGKASATDLHDQPYAELVKLALDADLKGSEVDELVVRLKDTGSDQEAIATLAVVRTESADRIREVGFTGRGRPSLSNQLRQHLGFISKHPAEAFVERNRDVAADHLARMESAAQKLADAIAAQQAHDNQMQMGGI